MFVVLSVAIGVAALTGVRGFSGAFRKTLLTQARSILAGDLSARMFQQGSPEELKGLSAIEAEGVRVTSVTELTSMGSAEKSFDPLLVSVKAVDPVVYPFYGSVEFEPAGKMSDVLAGDSVAVGEDLLIRLNLKLGDGLRVGEKIFRIAALVRNEPDRLSGSFSAGPRVLMSRASLDSSGLLGAGSHAGQRYLFKMAAGSTDAQVAAMKTRLIALLPEGQVTDYRETNPALTEGLDRATSLLSLMSLVALVLGAVGVAMAMRAHLQQRMDTIAIMKSLGARSGQIMRIYLLQTMLLGLMGGTLGVVLGAGVQLAFPPLLAKYINVHVSLSLQPRAIAVGLASGLLTTLLFTLPPLLDIRRVRPILILRRAVESNDDPFVAALVKRLRNNVAQFVAFLLIFAGLAALAATLSDSRQVGKWFTIGLVAVLLVLLAMSWVLLRVLRFLLSKTRLRLPSTLRQGLANLYRPGNPSAAMLAALGMGVMQMMTVFLMQQAVVKQLDVTTKANLPNVFLVDVSNREVDGVRTLLKSQRGVNADAVEMLPVVQSRILSIDGVAAADLKTKNFPKRMLRAVSLSWAEAPPPGTTVVKGKWWSADESGPQLSVGQFQAERLGVHVGSHVVLSAFDKQMDATVVALAKSDGQHAFSRAEFIMPPKALAGLPVVWYGGVHVDPKEVGGLQRAMYKNYPTITVINVAQVLETVRLVIIQITLVIQFLAAFSIFAGIVILASSIAGTKYRRVREVVVLKTLGATRGRIATVFSIEFAVLGLVAAAVGIVFANLVVRMLMKGMTMTYHVPWKSNIAGLLMTALLTVLTGWAASYRILGQKPLEVLREE